MKVIPPVEINELTLTATNVLDPFTATAWSGATTYGFGGIASKSGRMWQSLAAGNLNNDPTLSPLYWEDVGPLEAAYNSGTTYAANDYATYKHRVYQSLAAGNVGNNPLLSPTKWADVGPVNQYAMFDTLRSTATIAPSPLTCTVTPGVRISAAALLDVVADTVQLVMKVSGVTVYDSGSINLIEREVYDAYTYCFNPFKIKPNVVLFDLPPYTTAVLYLTLTKASGNVECGAFVIGTAVDVGAVQYGASDGQLNFSSVEPDEYGETELVRRKSVKEPQVTTWAASSQVDVIAKLRDDLNAVPAVWCGLEDTDNDYFRALLLLGIYTQFDIALTYTDTAVLTLGLREI